MICLGHVLVALAAALTLTWADMSICGNKYCGIDAVCSAQTNTCECPLSHPLGDPAFRCHGNDKVSCVLTGDPSLLGFSGDLSFMDFPCKYTFSKFDTPLLSRRHNSDPPNNWNTPDPGRDRCRVIVHGTNGVNPKGTYYLKDVNVVINFNIGGSSMLETMLIHLGNDSATYSYPPYGDVTVHRDDNFGCLPRYMDTFNSISLSLCYIPEAMIWSFGVPICGATFVNFRPWLGISENQPHRPGVSIMTTGSTALFFNEETGYPNTMCDSPFNDADDVYHESCKKMGIRGKRNCALHAFLSNNPPEQPHYCTPSIQLFNICTQENKVKATNACGSIVTELAKCVIKNGKNVLKIFETCLVAVCADPSYCSQIIESVHHGDDEDCNNFRPPC